MMDELRASWAAARVTPYDIYMKSLYALVSDRLEDTERGEILWDDEVTRSLAELARQVSNYHEAPLAEAGLKLEIVGDVGGSFDTPLLQRALSNLISNATRYGKRESTVRVEISRASASEVRLCVVNKGSTIDPKDLPRLFDRFYRVDQSRSDAHLSHGLGLSIVAAIARMHGGRPLATSQDGVSSIGMSLKDQATALSPPARSGEMDQVASMCEGKPGNSG